MIGLKFIVPNEADIASAASHAGIETWELPILKELPQSHCLSGHRPCGVSYRNAWELASSCVQPCKHLQTSFLWAEIPQPSQWERQQSASLELQVKRSWKSFMPSERQPIPGVRLLRRMPSYSLEVPLSNVTVYQHTGERWSISYPCDVHQQSQPRWHSLRQPA